MGCTALRKTLSTLQKCRSASHRSSPFVTILAPSLASLTIPSSAAFLPTSTRKTK